MLFIFAIITPVLADYNITCERECSSGEYTYCSNQTTTTTNYTTSPYNYLISSYYEEILELNISRGNGFFTLPDLTSTSKEILYDNKCTIKIIINEAGSTGDVSPAYCMYADWQLRLLNGSSLSWNDWQCVDTSTGEYVILTNDEKTPHGENDTILDCSRAEINDVVMALYDSTDGSCSGNLINSYPDDIPASILCNGAEELSIGNGYDVAYILKTFDQVEGMNITETKNWTGTGQDNYVPIRFTNTYYQTNPIYWDVKCDGSSYAVNLNRSIIVNGTCTYPDNEWLYNFTMMSLTVNYTECTNYTISCGLWGNPYNETLEYGCECPPSEDDYGLFCEGETCYRTCSGTEPTYYNETDTLSYVITSNNPIAFTEYVKNKTITTFNEIFLTDNMLWLIFGTIIIALFLFTVIFCIKMLTGGWK